MRLQKAYLYNNAHVNYGEISLAGCYIEFDFSTKVVFAKLCIDSTGNKVGVPLLSDGDTKTNSDSLRFNFESKRGITYQVKLQEGEGYIHGSKVKRQSNGDIHIDTALYTTCNLDHPHYYFKLRKAIIKPDDRIVSGPVNLYIADVPTPLGLPFGYFPNKKGGGNGIVIPTYGESALGFYLLGGGYYHKFKNDKVATQLLGDIYSKGSWGVSNITQYTNRYKYSGELNLNYRQVKQGDPWIPTEFAKSTEFFIKWRHKQDKKARPNSTFSGTINAGTSTNFKNNYNNVNSTDYLSNNFNSNIAWSKQIGLFKGKIGTNLNVNLRHNQNSKTHLVTFTLPEATYNINRFYPFKLIKSKKAVASSFRKELNKIGINYNTTLKSEAAVADSTLSLNNLESTAAKIKHGMRQNIATSTSFKLLNKTITVNPSYQLTQLLYLDQVDKSWNNTLQEEKADTSYGFATPFWHTFTASATTKVYGFYQFAKFLQGARETKIRHTITPNINFSYRPNNSYLKSYYIDTANTNPIEVNYSPYQNNIFGSPSAGSSERIGFSLINAFEMKQKNLKDTTGKSPFIKTKLLDNLTFNGAYDFIPTEFNLSNITMSGRTILKKNINMRFGGTLDPYTYLSGIRTNIFEMKQSGNLGTVKNVNLALSFSLKSSKGHKGEYKTTTGDQNELAIINANPDAYVDFSIPWRLNFNYKIDRNRNITSENDTVFYTQTIGVNGDLSLTQNWKIEFITNYDFVKKQFSYSSLNIHRDLHCWEASFNWIPFGLMKSYNIQINVKSSLLQDLKLQRRRTWYDNGVR